MIIVTGTLDADFTGPFITNTASVESTRTPDPRPGNNTVSSEVPVLGESHLVMKKTADLTVVAGRPLTWTISVTNAGPSTAHAVEITDTLPSGISDVSLDLPSRVHCDPAPAAGVHLTCTVDGNFAVGDAGKVVMTVTATVDPDVANGTVIANTATATSIAPDPAPGENTATAETTVTTSADLSVTKTGPASAVAGEAISWKVVASNRRSLGCPGGDGYGSDARWSDRVCW